MIKLVRRLRANACRRGVGSRHRGSAGSLFLREIAATMVLAVALFSGVRLESTLQADSEFYPVCERPTVPFILWSLFAYTAWDYGVCDDRPVPAVWLPEHAAIPRNGG